MNCPYCEYSGHRMDLHAHLLDSHEEEVKVYVDEETGKMVYEVNCPICGDKVGQQLKKPPAVLRELGREIKMVAFDMLLYHLMEKHEDGNISED